MILSWLRKEAATLKRLRGRQLRNYIADYYRLPIGAAAMGVILLGASALYGAQSKAVLASVVLVNARPEAAQEDTLFEELTPLVGDPETGRIQVDANFRLRYSGAGQEDSYTVQALAALFGMGGMDLFISNREVFDAYVAKDGFEDLSQWLPPEVLAAWEDRLYWCVDTQGNPIAAGIWMDPRSPLLERGYYDKPVLAGIASQAEKREEAAVLAGLLLD